MIKINSEAWHYKCQDYMFQETPKSLCAYLWKVLFSLVMIVLFSVTVLTLFVGWVAGLLTPIFPVLEVGIAVTFLSYASLGLITLAFAVQFRKQDGFWFKIRGTKPAKEGSLAYFVKKRHSKICPLIEVV